MSELTVCVRFQEKDQRSLDLNTAKCMLGLLLGKTWPLFPVFNQFLEVLLSSFLLPNLPNILLLSAANFLSFWLQQSKYKVVNKDQWCNVLEFSRTINLDLSNYDEDGACKFSHTHTLSYIYPLKDATLMPEGSMNLELRDTVRRAGWWDCYSIYCFVFQGRFCWMSLWSGTKIERCHSNTHPCLHHHQQLETNRQQAPWHQRQT